MIKNILKKKEINYSLILFLLSIVILNTYILVSITMKNNKKDNIFRLHVVANSNSIDDQITKLKVETEVEKFLNEINYDENDNIVCYFNDIDEIKKRDELELFNEFFEFQNNNKLNKGVLSCHKSLIVLKRSRLKWAI